DQFQPQGRDKKDDRKMHDHRMNMGYINHLYSFSYGRYRLVPEPSSTVPQFRKPEPSTVL
ncbi:MAG TPA: hypothetical protein VKA13_05175, partial [Gammaproteobacteria bacterium]|nr:hypothetical protein [Gammaproteobacteria bacterium]